LKPQVYKDERPAEYFTKYYERAQKARPSWVYQVVRMFLTPYLLVFFRTRCIDSDKVPIEGPVIIAPNHFSFMDHFFIAVYMRRKVQFMAKSQMFKPPLAPTIYGPGGVFPIRRGQRDEESIKTAHAILARGNIVVMYCEGGRSRTGKLGEPKPGIGKIALESGAVVVPSGIAGSAKVRNWKKLQFPKVTVQYGDPIRFDKVENPTREQAQEAANVIFAGIEQVYYGLAQPEGRRRAVVAARAARRRAAAAGRKATEAAEAAGRRPVKY
jgi:1-acyl-sn-glycerol-3-phosphate acyltransferase